MLGFFLFRFIYFVVFLFFFCCLVDDDVPQNAIFVNPESEFVTALKSDIKNDSGMLVSRQL